MIEGVKEDKELREILSSFSCDQDEDIQNFLLERAVEFEKLSKTRTYLICDQEQLENEDEEALVIYYIWIYFFGIKSVNCARRDI